MKHNQKQMARHKHSIASTSFFLSFSINLSFFLLSFTRPRKRLTSPLWNIQLYTLVSWSLPLKILTLIAIGSFSWLSISHIDSSFCWLSFRFYHPSISSFPCTILCLSVHQGDDAFMKYPLKKQVMQLKCDGKPHRKVTELCRNSLGIEGRG